MTTLSPGLKLAFAPGAALLPLFLASSAPAPISGPPGQGAVSPGAVYTATNDATANAVLAFRRNAAGRLVQMTAHATGGAGSGGGLGNQGALALDRPGKHLLAVNAGSDTVSVFGVGPQGLELLDIAPSGGAQPISVTVDGDLVYVLNAGGDGNISGLQLSRGGQLSTLPGSSRPLSASGVGPAQISFTPDGRFLVVTEKGTNSIVTYPVDRDGLPGDAVVTPSEGMTPFGFSFGHRSRLLVSEAAGGAGGMSTVSSYDLRFDGSLEPITSALATTQSAACWLVATGSGRFAYVTNTGSDTVTGLAVGRDGSLGLLDPTGVSAPAGDAPIDAAVTRDDRFLYVLDGGDDTIHSYEIGAHGALVPIETISGLPASVNGLAAR